MKAKFFIFTLCAVMGVSPALAQTTVSNATVADSATQSQAEAWFDLGWEADERQDYKEAFKWYSKAANQGYAVAQYNLGVMYENGSGVPKTTKKPLSGTKNLPTKVMPMPKSWGNV